MNSFDRRTSKILATLKQSKAVRSRHDPFVELRIHSFMEDVAEIIYRPQGFYGGEDRTRGLGFNAALAAAEAYKVPVYTDMSLCCEWVYAFTMRRNDYTEEQKAMFKADFMKSPGVRKFCECAEAEELIDVLASIPQRIRIF